MGHRDLTPAEREECERLSEWWRDKHYIGPEELVTSVEIVVRSKGRDVLIALPNAHLPGGVAKVKGKWKIYFRPGTLDLNHVIAHEIGHIVLTESEFPSPLVIEMEEEYANAIGAALLAPRDLVRRAYEIYGEDKLRPLAKTFAISMTSAQLRLGETRGDERAVITETGHLLTRTQGAFPWRESPVEDLRHSPQLAKVRLSGGIDRGRTALRAK